MVNTTDQDWEIWGQKDPYFGVLTDEKFRANNITEGAKLDFFESGSVHIEHVLSICKKHFDPDFAPTRALDFGCGVGRLVIPLSKLASEVVGLDISTAMLKEANDNCQKYNISNVRLSKSDDNLSALTGKFDFIHSFITLQHISARRGNHIITKLIEHLSDKGIAVVHITYAKNRYSGNLSFLKVDWLRNFLQHIYRNFKHYWRKLTKLGDAPMQMNIYDLNNIIRLIQSAEIDYSINEFTNHGGELGVLLYFQKKARISGCNSKP